MFFHSLVAYQGGPHKQGRPRSDCFWSLIRVFPVWYSDKYFVISSPENQHLVENWKRSSVRNFRAVTWDFQQCGMGEQQSLRSACTYVQPDQSLCKTLAYSMSVKLLNVRTSFGDSSLKGGCTESSESTLVKILHCWKSHVTAQILLIVPYFVHILVTAQNKCVFPEHDYPIELILSAIRFITQESCL